MDAESVLALIGGQQDVRAYLRGLEEGSEADRDAERAMLAAIASIRAAGVRDAMAEAEPRLYGQAALLFCRMWTDCEDAGAAAISQQIHPLILALRYDERNVKEEVNDNG